MGQERALVLGGGGLAGIAWQTGVLFGLAEEGADVTGADLVIGTSAGAAVGAQLGSGLPLAELYERQADPARQNAELTPGGSSVEELTAKMVTLAEQISDVTELRRQIGELALSADTPTEAARREVINARLPKQDWPAWLLYLVAVEVRTGESIVFDRDSGVDLVDAVAASCAVPGVWPPVTIEGARYMDGGMRTFTNVDLAGSYQRVLVIAPMVESNFHDQLARLSGRTESLRPDGQALAAFGTDVLDPAVRAPAAKAGRDQGKRAAERVSALWN
ncbi:MAG TPA: patatin-like phospholipase family protein [Pseudonocardia sp.]|jgi:NTE family protein|nr:patatin-like phospholipase family protein [Pseudonocardia sp.]